jgi:hypothetical protein
VRQLFIPAKSPRDALEPVLNDANALITNSIFIKSRNEPPARGVRRKRQQKFVGSWRNVIAVTGQAALGG